MAPEESSSEQARQQQLSGPDAGTGRDEEAEDMAAKVQTNRYPVWILLRSDKCSHVGWTYSRKEIHAHTGASPSSRAILRKFPRYNKEAIKFWEGMYGYLTYIGIPKLPKRCDCPWHELAEEKIKPTKCRAYVAMEPVDPAAEAEGVVASGVEDYQQSVSQSEAERAGDAAPREPGRSQH